MKKTIIDYLEDISEKYPSKIAFEDINKKITYKELNDSERIIGTEITNLGEFNKPIAVVIDKSVVCVEAMLGIVRSGNFYTVIDTKSPDDRINKILTTLNPFCIITDKKNIDKVHKLQFKCKVLIYEDIIEKSIIDNKKLSKINNNIIDTNPMYILFTSGSTGVPKGVVISHRALTSYTTWVKETFDINENTIFGSQTPFYFSMSVTDVFTTIMTGATLQIIPKMYFSFPVKLLEYLNEKEVNTIYWVPSALCIVANLGALDEIELPLLKKVLFAGEIMPMKQLNIWRRKLTNTFFANLFGPTETTDICTYYVVDRDFTDEQTLPIGKHCNNCDVFIIKEDGTEAKQGEEGELYVRGSFLANGYYRNQEKTNAAFVQNPLNSSYPEIVYKTGDIVKENEQGEILYISRSDFQIKHMGYRIELGEIETAINSIDGIVLCACVYDINNSKIVLFYQGQEIDEKELLDRAKQKLPNYMCPNEIKCITKMPYNANGKIDRNKLKEMI